MDLIKAPPVVACSSDDRYRAGVLQKCPDKPVGSLVTNSKKHGNNLICVLCGKKFRIRKLRKPSEPIREVST